MISLESFEEQWLEEVRAGEPSTTLLGNRFAQKMLRDWHEIDDATTEIILCDGAGDGGIDAAVFLKADPDEGNEGDAWLLIQSKYGSAFAGATTVALEAQKVFATLEGKRASLSSLSGELVQRLRTFLENKGPKDRLEYVLATSRKLTEDELGYLENVRVLGRAKFGDCFDTDSISIETIYKKVLEEDAQSGEPGLSVALRTTVTTSTDMLLIGATTLPHVFAFMQDYKAKSGDLDMLYEKNVRQFLGGKRKVNKGIEQTLEHYPERFGLYNNGITIVAESLSQAPDGNSVTLVAPFIVNGCQTTRTIWSVLQRKLNAGGSAPTDAQRDWETRVHQGVVVTKIVVVGKGGDELLTDTTRYTNSQNAVGEKDFIALEKEFREWAPAFNHRYGVFLEIQRGAWEARRAYQRQNPTAEHPYEESANAFELLKAYAAGWLNEPGIAFGKNPPFAPGGSFFTKIVNEPGFNVESLYAAYQVQKLANTYGFGRAAVHPSRRQTRYLFIMALIDLLKDHLVHIGKARSNPNATAAVVTLADADLLAHFGTAAVGVIDDYLTDGAEDSIFIEPAFTHDLNAFLKSERLAKSDEFSPNLRTQLALARKDFRRREHVGAITDALADLE